MSDITREGGTVTIVLDVEEARALTSVLGSTDESVHGLDGFHVYMTLADLVGDPFTGEPDPVSV